MFELKSKSFQEQGVNHSAERAIEEELRVRTKKWIQCAQIKRKEKEGAAGSCGEETLRVQAWLKKRIL